MLSSLECLEKFGLPNPDFERANMVLWDVPEKINYYMPALPNKIYCNKIMVNPLKKAFENIINRGLATQVKTWDGCFNVRKKRGLKSWSIHSWGLAIDINAAWNGLGKEPTMSLELVQCFTDARFDWGGKWIRKDGMHFQLKKI